MRAGAGAPGGGLTRPPLVSPSLWITGVGTHGPMRSGGSCVRMPPCSRVPCVAMCGRSTTAPGNCLPG
ncbi:hypothetical protein FRAAL0017 [Frankia alni ACN14a]|uniref:Uncharacterized protein n=1 Tax=Frankia alni (strain DSM 45986 / CECT 9034 / ACN14a) TaxID=326424 RepID=Q0RUN9_FRAAA|nr:hypothetical protein FRAAL0017 [Frankia alni ACN14a]